MNARPSPRHIPPLGIPLLILAVGFAAPPAARAQDAADTLRPGRFDFGKMWTFEYPPTEYFTSTYGFDANPGWFENARLAALRIPGCSASFVSPNGLVVTNHHCARGRAIAPLSRPGENLLDDGFYAASLEDERPIPGYYADQLMAVEDVTDEVFAAVDAAPAERRQEAREGAISRIQGRIEAAHAGSGPIRVEVTALYHGGRYSAYVFRRFTDVRLVAAVELDLGFFGGDPDNFTYPRYALDFAFYRIYGEDGQPYRTDHWFRWGEGVEEGDAVFIIGNPGPTNRLNTVAQLEYQRDVLVPARERWFRTRLGALRAAYAADPVVGERLDLRNQAFSLSNSLKAYTGRRAALEDPDILDLKRAAERELMRRVLEEPELSRRYGSLIAEVAAIQARKRELGPEYGAFYRFGAAGPESMTLMRAVAAAELLEAGERGVARGRLEAGRAALARIDDHEAPLEAELLALRMEDLLVSLHRDDPLIGLALRGGTPAEAAARLLETSALATSEGTASALAAGTLERDPAVELGRALAPRIAAWREGEAALAALESELAADLGRARFEVYGTEMAPDATSSPRITDGVVKGYEYNGTLAPPYTTLFGLYDHFHSYGQNPEWNLPERWRTPPAGLDLATPLNFVSTADTYGGNSGSPAVTRDLAIVGLNFDRNIEGLSRDFIYLPERGRNIMVDVRAILETLDDLYDADRIVMELLTGELFRTEAEADARGR
ncbi:MAG TPA: S46 family peptidase [Longimicrobiales bacterium]|jgi:hypothetical protein